MSWIAIGILLVASPTAAQPRDHAAIKAVFADWQARQKAFKTVRYTISGTSEFLKPLSPDSPQPAKENRSRPYRAVVVLDLERTRVRLESTEFLPAADGGYTQHGGTAAFDGRETRQSPPPEVVKNGAFDLSITKRSNEREEGIQFDSQLWPVLLAHGFVPTVHQPGYVEHLRTKWDAEDFVAHGRHTFRGAVCQVFRTEPTGGASPLSDEFWVSPERRSAVLRYVYLSGGKPIERFDIDWAESGGNWMLRGWTNTLSVDGKTANRIYTLKVERFEADPAVSDADFTIPAVPGMKQVHVAEPPPPGVPVHPGYPGRRTYRIADDGEWVETNSQGWKSADGKTEIPLPSRWGLWPWAIGGVIVLLGVWAVFRRRGRRATPASSAA